MILMFDILQLSRNIWKEGLQLYCGNFPWPVLISATLWITFWRILNHVGGSFNISWPLLGMSFRIGLMCHTLNPIDMSSKNVANIIKSSLLFSQQFLGFVGGKHYQQMAIPIFKLVLRKLCLFHVAFVLSSLISLSFLFTFVWLDFHCSKWLYVSPGN